MTSGGETETRRERDESDSRVWFLSPTLSSKYFMSGGEMPAGELRRGTTCLIHNCTEICGSERHQVKAKMLHKANMTNTRSHNESNLNNNQSSQFCF